MVFWDRFFSKKQIQHKQHILFEITKILDQEFVPAIKQPIEHCSQIWQKILQNFSMNDIATTLYSKISQYDTMAIIKLAEVMLLWNEHPNFLIFLQLSSISNHKDRNLIWVGHLLYLNRKKPITPKVLDQLKVILTNAIGAKATNAVLLIIHGHLPPHVTDISLIKGTIITPLFSILARLVVHRRTEIRQHAVTMLGNVAGKNIQAISLLVKTLQDPKAVVCKVSANTLLTFGVAILPYLYKVLDKPTLSVRVKISITWLIGHWAKKSIACAPKLIADMKINNPQLRQTLIHTLSKMGPEIMPQIWKQLEHSPNDEFLLLGIAKLLTKMKPPLTPEIRNFLIPLLQHPSLDIQVATVEALGEMLLLTLDMTKNLLKNQALRVQIAILREICRRHLGSPDLLDDIIPLTKSPTPDNLREIAILALGQSSVSAPHIIPILFEFIREPNLAIQKSAVLALGAQDNEHAEEIFHLLRQLVSPEAQDDLIIAVITTVGQLRCVANITLSWLQQFLNQSKVQFTIAAIKALGELGESAEPAVPILLQLLQQRNPKLQPYIGETLLKIGTSVTPKLLEMATYSPIELKGDIIGILTRFGMNIKSDLVAALTGTSPAKRQVAVDVLGKLGECAFNTLLSATMSGDFWIYKAVSRAFEKNGKVAVSYLIRLLQQPVEPEISAIAIDALKKMKQKSLVQLLPYLGHENPRLSQLALQAIKQTGPEYKDCVNELLPMLKHSSPMTRRATLWCLEKIQVATPNILSALQSVQNQDEDPQVRQQAEQSLNGLLNVDEVDTSKHNTAQD